MNCPEPGIYENVPFEEYIQWPAMNASTLVHGTTSMLHLKTALDSGSEDTPDLKFGRACHHYMLEPDTFDDHWHVSTTCSAIIASGDREGEACGKKAKRRGVNGFWFCGSHGKGLDDEPNMVAEEEWERIQAIGASVARHPACRLIRGQGGCEVCVVGEIDGVLCKGRIDKRIAPGGDGPAAIIDLKKVQPKKLHDHALQKAVGSYNYHIKAEFYRRLIEAHDRCSYRFFWVFVEDKPPHDVRVVEPDHKWRDVGESEVERLLSEYRACLKSGRWRGVSETFDTLPCPEWRVNRLEVGR